MEYQRQVGTRRGAIAFGDEVPGLRNGISASIFFSYTQPSLRSTFFFRLIRIHRLFFGGCLVSNTCS